MPQKRKKRPQEKVVHFLKIRGLWSHFFIFCGLVMLGWLLLSPFADTNPSWKQPEKQSLNAALEQIHGVSGVPKRFVDITVSDTRTFLINGEKNPFLYLRPGQTVRLVFQNSSTEGIYTMTIVGQKLHVVSLYGKIPEQVIEEEHLTVLPGKSIEILLTPTWYGDFPIKAFYHPSDSSYYDETTLMHIRVVGIPMLPSPLPIKLTP